MQRDDLETRRDCDARIPRGLSSDARASIWTEQEVPHKGPEYETVWANGRCGINDLDVIAGSTGSMATSASIQSKWARRSRSVDSGYIQFSDGKEAVRLIREEKSARRPLGRILGNGAAVWGKHSGRAFKSEASARLRPRPIKSIGHIATS
jgi:aldehyde:ferredoxin oxidoreductase